MAAALVRLSPRQRRLLERARDAALPGAEVGAFVAEAFAAAPDAPAPPAPAVEDAPDLVPPGTAAAVELRRGAVVRVEQVAGGQCVDVLALGHADRRERLSPAHTRALERAGAPALGSRLWSGPPRERPILRLVADSAPGHDLLFPACSPAQYCAAGLDPEPSCHALHAAALAPFGIEPHAVPNPLNLWFSSWLEPGGSIAWRTTPTQPGDHVELLALADVVVVMNPCVDDVVGCSGFALSPVRVRVRAAPHTPAEPVALARSRCPLPFDELAVPVPAESAQAALAAALRRALVVTGQAGGR